MKTEPPKRGCPPLEGEAAKAIYDYLSTIGKKGGKKKSAAKRRANREKILQYWSEVKAGIRKKPNVGRKKNAPEVSGQE